MTKAGGHFREHPASVRAEARRLRREGNSITEVAAALGLAHSTVGDWLRGVEPEHECPLCGATVVGSWGRFCSTAHRVKYRDVFGATRSYERRVR